MIGFVILFFCFVFGLFLAKNKKLFLCYIGLCLIVFMSLRNPLDYIMGNTKVYDVWVYYNHYYLSSISDAPLINTSDALDVGYNYGIFIISKIIKWPQFILFLEAAIYITLMLVFISKHTQHFIVALICLLTLGPWTFSMTAFRQAIVIAIMYSSIHLVFKRKWLQYTLLVLLMSTIHRSAIIFLLAGYIAMLPFSFHKKFTIIIICGLSLLIFCNAIFLFANVNFLRIVSSSEAIDHWLNGIVNVLLYFSTIFLAWPCCWQDKIFKEQNYVFLFFCMFGLFFYLMRYQIQLFERMSFYFFPSICILLPNAISNYFIRRNEREWCFMILILCSIGLFLKRIFDSFLFQTYII